MNRLAMLRPAVRRLALCLLLSALASCHRAGTPAETSDAAAPLAGAAIGGPFELTDPSGKTVRWSDFAGRYRVVYFGYTYCPDVCPLDTQRLVQGLNLFKRMHPQLGRQIQPMFISIDPQRDTPAKMGEYTRAFSNDLLGLTGTPEQVDAAAKAFKVFYQKVPGGKGEQYLMNHSRTAYLMGRKGEPIALLPVDVDDGGKSVAAELEKWVS